MIDNIVSFHGHPPLDDRQAAERKLCRLFKSFGVNALDRPERLIDPFLDRATALWRPHAGADFAALAMQEAHNDLETWFAALLGEALEDRAAAVMTGRAAFLMCNAPEKWADQLLRPLDNVDAAFGRAIVDHAPSAVPPSSLGEMHHQRYEAWSPSLALLRAIPIERNFFQDLVGLVRRDPA